MRTSFFMPDWLFMAGWMYLLMMCIFVPPWQLRAQDLPSYLGRSSCASATCHGGVVGRGPAWNSSLSAWEARDAAHAGAGNVLLREQSRQMAMRLMLLDQGNARTADLLSRNAVEQVNEDELRIVLQTRCASCHAPQVTMKGTLWDQGIQEGVSCEACHGPASKWKVLHLLKEPNPHELETSGKIATNDWSARTENCVRCHVGSRVADGSIRDMNHDMIAAGHPALWFNMAQYQMELPAHWHVDPNKLLINQSLPYEVATPSEHFAARQQTLQAVVRLSHQRQQHSSSQGAPTPELAEYDCLACHSSLGSARQLPGARHGIAWNHFYTSRIVLDRFPIGDAEFVNGLAALFDQAEPEHTRVSLPQALRWAATLPMVGPSAYDWPMARNWWSVNRLALFHAGPNATNSRALPPDPRTEFLASHDAARLTTVLESYRHHLESTKVPKVETAHGPHAGQPLSQEAQVNFEQLQRIRSEYIHHILNIFGSVDSVPPSGDKP